MRGPRPAHGGEHLHRVRLPPTAEQPLAEPLAVAAAQPAVLVEPLDHVRVEHLAPDVGVVARVVPAGEDVLEVGAAVARAARGRGRAPCRRRAACSNASTSVGRHRGVRARAGATPGRAGPRRGTPPWRSPRRSCWRPAARRRRLRQRLAGLVVPGVVREDLRPQRPHLVDLGGELDEVARARWCPRAAGRSRRRRARAARARTRGTPCGPRRWSAGSARRRAAAAR